MIPSRRRFLFGATAALVAAPAIVRVAANLMPVSVKAFGAVGNDVSLMLQPGFLSPEDMSFIEGMSQTMDALIWYGDGSQTPFGFHGAQHLLSMEVSA